MQLRVLDYTGLNRSGEFSDHDLILTTYGTLRRDAASLKDVEFDYVILDEAQAVKNSNCTESAKAVRLLSANIGWRWSAARLSKTIWANSGRCSSF